MDQQRGRRFSSSQMKVLFLLLWTPRTLYFSPLAAAAKSLQSCPTLYDPIDGSPPGSAVPGILQARTLEWAAVSSSNACMHAESLQSCLPLHGPMDSRPPGSSVPRILQARILEWVAISFSSTSLAIWSMPSSIYWKERNLPFINYTLSSKWVLLGILPYSYTLSWSTGYRHILFHPSFHEWRKWK